MTILEAAGSLRAKKVSSRELTDEALKRIEQENPRINAFITVVADLARAAAAKADEELARGVEPRDPDVAARRHSGMPQALLARVMAAMS